MKNDRLEHFIDENREAFDNLEPGAMVWAGIEKQKGRTISARWRRVGVRAVAAVVIFIASYYFHDFMQNRKSTQERLVSEKSIDGQTDMYHELQEAKYYYTSQIEETRAVVFAKINDNIELKNDIDTELLDLDKVLKELKSDLKDNLNNNEVVEAMIQNYRFKLNILKDILQHLNSFDEKNNEDETPNVNI